MLLNTLTGGFGGKASKIYKGGKALNKINDARKLKKAVGKPSKPKLTKESDSAPITKSTDAERLTRKSKKYGSKEQREILLKQIKKTRNQGIGKSQKRRNDLLKEAKGEVDGFRKMRKQGFELQDIEIKFNGNQGLDQVFRNKGTGEFAINEAKHGKGFGKLKKSGGKGKPKLRQGSKAYNRDRLEKFREQSAENRALTKELHKAMRDKKVKSFTTSYKGKSHREIISDDPVPNFRDKTTFREVE